MNTLGLAFPTTQELTFKLQLVSQQIKKLSKPKQKKQFPAKKELCPDCNKEFISLTKHTECMAGNCKHCGLFLRNIINHRCPIVKYHQELKPNDVLEFLNRNKCVCDQCHVCHPLSRNSFRQWKDENLCVDCFRKRDLHEHINDMWLCVRQWQMKKKYTKCEMCHLKVLSLKNKTTPVVKAQYEFDHTNFWDKEHSISTMIKKGHEWSNIELELKKCRVLCLQCHSWVTAAEYLSGYIDLKRSITSIIQDQPQPQDQDKPQDRHSHDVINKWRKEVEENYHDKITTVINLLKRTATTTRMNADADDVNKKKRKSTNCIRESSSSGGGKHVKKKCKIK